MATQERLQLDDTLMSAVQKMSDGNPGVMMALMNVYQEAPKIDPQSDLGGFGPFMSLDLYGIYGKDIYALYKDICGGSAVNFIAVLRATQLGLFDNLVLADACSRQDRSGRNMVPVDDLYEQVKERLTEFDRHRAESVLS